MSAISPGLAAHKGLRGHILLELKKDQPLTARELAQRHSVSVTAIRRHLKELEAEGVVAFVRERKGQGAPVFEYRLTEASETLFPNSYEEALTRMLEHVVEKEGRRAAVEVVEGQYRELKRKLPGEPHEMSPSERLTAVARVLEEAGFMAEADSNESRLNMHNCAIHAVALQLPEVCETERQFLEDVLDADVVRGAHILDGCNNCTYEIDFASRHRESARGSTEPQ